MIFAGLMFWAWIILRVYLRIRVKHVRMTKRLLSQLCIDFLILFSLGVIFIFIAGPIEAYFS